MLLIRGALRREHHRWRAMQAALWLVAAAGAALPLLVAGDRPTHCDRWKGDSEFRCKKDGYMADIVHIRSIAKTNVTFKVSKLRSPCGGPVVTLYWAESFSLPRGGHMDVDFDEAASGTCNDLYVYECQREKASIDCLQIVSVYPTVAAATDALYFCQSKLVPVPVLPMRDGATWIY